MTSTTKPRPDLFAHVLNNLNYGATASELSERLSECVAASRDMGKKSEITLKIKIKPDRSGNGQYSLESSISHKVPEPERGATIMFGTPEGNLQREDPNQQSLDLKSVDDPANQAALKQA